MGQWRLAPVIVLHCARHQIKLTADCRGQHGMPRMLGVVLDDSLPLPHKWRVDCNSRPPIGMRRLSGRGAADPKSVWLSSPHLQLQNEYFHSLNRLLAAAFKTISKQH